MTVSIKPLKPCPFCGGEAIEKWPTAGTWHFIECKRCGCRTIEHLASHGGSAADDWNRRAALAHDEQAEPVAWLVDLDGTGSLHPASKGDHGSFPVFAAPIPEQASDDLRKQLAEEEKAHERTLAERDTYHEWADKLAHAIGGADVGEHSSLNNPWQNALEFADEGFIPDGWRLVPVAATREMLDAFFNTMILRRPLSECYVAMLAASPRSAS